MSIAVDFHEYLALFGGLLELVVGDFLEEAGPHLLCYVLRPILNIFELFLELTIDFSRNTLGLHLLLQLLNLLVFDILTFKHSLKCLLKPAPPHTIHQGLHPSNLSRSCLPDRQSFHGSITAPIKLPLITLAIFLRGLAFSDKFEDCRDFG